MPEQQFDAFKGLVVNGFTFRGVDKSDGATFEHQCGYVVRIGPDAKISVIAEEVRGHDCARDFDLTPYGLTARPAAG